MERGSSSSAVNDLRRNDASLLQGSQLVGIEQPKQELVRLLLEDAISNSQVVASTDLLSLKEDIIHFLSDKNYLAVLN
ncbi:hypothetical protein L484_007309 [Morus notabilis]|uniref:Uncharacterized protein n=1 Tax=Morus notabilis TaxID=981085 RepID=W9QLV1_9ROSA|nr:hypothetical protein L484_007309 [Morus notabilis]